MKHRTITTIAAAAAVAAVLAGCTGQPPAPQDTTTAQAPAASPRQERICTAMEAATGPTDDPAAAHQALQDLRSTTTPAQLLDAAEDACPHLTGTAHDINALDAVYAREAAKEADRDAREAQALCDLVRNPTPAARAQWEAGWIDVTFDMPDGATTLTMTTSVGPLSAPEIVATTCPDLAGALERL